MKAAPKPKPDKMRMVSFRCSVSLWRKVVVRAVENDRTVQEYAADLLRAGIGEEGK